MDKHDNVCGVGLQQKVDDLHDLRVQTDGRYHKSHLMSNLDNSGLFDNAKVQVYFRDLERHLCNHIRKAPLVAGAVAWLTSEQILKALVEVKHGVSIVVQKEDFLRPDLASKPGFAKALRKLYDRLPDPPDRYCDWPYFSHMSACSDPTIQSVRCVGNHNRERKPAFPRMHNKFLVFCNYNETLEDSTDERIDDVGHIVPYAVWTGSFNFTKNAASSFENALYIEDPRVAQAYLNEFGQIMALSEPLNWESDWCAPEWRIGT